MSAYKFDTIGDYDIFKVEVRKIEGEIVQKREEQEETTKNKCNAMNKVVQKSEFSKLKELLQQMNKRIAKLEQAKEERQNTDDDNFYRPRCLERGRGRLIEN